MLNLLLQFRTPIATILGAIVAVIVFLNLELRWYLSLPLAFVAMILTAAAWGIFLGFWERAKGFHSP